MQGSKDRIANAGNAPRTRARAVLLERLRAQPVQRLRCWMREELYDEAEQPTGRRARLGNPLRKSRQR